jgi:hypothetical protein
MMSRSDLFVFAVRSLVRVRPPIYRRPEPRTKQNPNGFRTTNIEFTGFTNRFRTNSEQNPNKSLFVFYFEPELNETRTKKRAFRAILAEYGERPEPIPNLFRTTQFLHSRASLPRCARHERPGWRTSPARAAPVLRPLRRAPRASGGVNRPGGFTVPCPATYSLRALSQRPPRRRRPRTPDRAALLGTPGPDLIMRRYDEIPRS